MKKLFMLVLTLALFVSAIPAYADTYLNPDQRYLSWPTSSKRMVTGGEYGTPRSNGRTHRGIDIGPTTAGTANEPVFAAQSGTVVNILSNASTGYGNVIIINHDVRHLNIMPSYLRTVYTHVDDIKVSVGDTVRRGQTIADMSNSGTGGIHLHFEVHNISSMSEGYNSWSDGTGAHFNPLNMYDGYIPPAN